MPAGGAEASGSGGANCFQRGRRERPVVATRDYQAQALARRSVPCCSPSCTLWQSLVQVPPGSQASLSQAVSAAKANLHCNAHCG
eukprot:scaffold33702_cov112-Isochrysis_galbana.AAC.6